ncbi:MAG: triosephosphate isomerase [Candidatus Doudnabacteria bacterium]|nr:triosephosphate isomerase [Candidatus Doudnabacteria bacterium]
MKKLVVANWKMNPVSLDLGRKIFMSIEHRMHLAKNTEAVICPPSLFLPAFSHYSAKVKLGAQNLSWEEQGAFTGEISPLMVKAFKTDYAILGHSERRLFFGETDSMVAFKLYAALKHKLIPIVCLGGEKNAKKDDMKKLVAKQFKAVTRQIEKKDLHRIVFVYEPVWAISTMKNSEPATGEHANELVEYIHELAGVNSHVLYGGTVNKNNVQQFAKYPMIDGALVGAASLDPDNFWQIIKEFERESIHRG